MVVIDGQVNVVRTFHVFPTKLSNISPVLTEEKNTFAGLHYFQAAGTVSNSSIFQGIEPSQGVIKLHHPFSNNHIHTFSEVLCSVRHHKSKCPEARRNWLCCRFLDFLVPERGISYPGLNTQTQSPVGDKNMD